MNLAISLRSEFLKVKRTPALFLTIGVGALVPLLMCIDKSTPEPSTADVSAFQKYYFESFLFLNFVILPIFVVLVTTLLVQNELKNNTWKQVLTAPQTFFNIYISKFLVVQALIVLFLLTHNVLMIVVAGLLDLFVGDKNLLSYLGQTWSIIVLNFNTYIALLGIAGLMHWFAFRFKSFVAPIAIGFVLWLPGPLLAFEHILPYADLNPFSIPVISIGKSYQDTMIAYQFLSVAYLIVFLAIGFFDFFVRHRKSSELIPEDLAGNPFALLGMRKNVALIAYRSLVKDKSYTFINIFGLTIGLTCSMLLLIYVLDELSFDNYHEKGDRIYRVVSKIQESDNEFTWAVTPVPLGEELREEPGAIKNAVRFVKMGRQIFRSGDKQFYETNFYLTDSTIFDIFTYSFLVGDAATSLDEPSTVVITKSIAEKYFGSVINSLGQTLENQKGDPFKVTGVIEDVPVNSHFRFGAVLSISTFRNTMPKSWGRMGSYTYIELSPDAYKSDVHAQLDSVIKRHVDPIFKPKKISTQYDIQRITDIHLNSKIQDEAEAGGDMSYIYIFSAVAFFMLIIACINYMNLTTARSANRAKEVGIRKVIGSQRIQLVGQFLMESILLAAVAMVCSIGLVYLLLPAFNHVANKNIEFNTLLHPSVVLVLLLITFLVGVVGGSYPALYLSGFNPSEVLKGARISKSGSASFRKVLVVCQFSISIFMMIATLIVSDQLDFLRNRDLGFTKEQVVSLSLSGQNQREKDEELKRQLRQLPGVVDVGLASAAPGERIGKRLLKVEDNEGVMSDRGVDLFAADYDFVKTMGMSIVQGRDFSPEISSDTLYAILVNEAMVKRMGWTEPIGKRFVSSSDGGNEKRVVGVVKDYHQSSLYDEIEPLIIYLSDENNDKVFVRTSQGDVRAALGAIENVWKKVFPTDPFEYTFLDQDFNSQYQADEKRSYIFTIFSGLTMVIACLGLLGLASFVTEQRGKEIGLRKIAGADVSSIVYLIAKDFFRLVGYSILLALPMAWFFTSHWLENFAYRISLSDEWLTFLLAALIAAILTFVTTGYHVIRRARMNPVTVLRD